MFTIQNIMQPETVKEAYDLLMQRKTNTLIGGSAFLRMGTRKIGTAIELSKLNLNYINECSGYIEIGAMATLRDIETNSALKEYFNGVLPRAVGNVIGVQFRNMVTVGASVYSKYGFSDLITALLALDTEVELHEAGRMSLEEFLNAPYKRDILTRVIIKKNKRMASYMDFRNSASDFPILNVAVSNEDNNWKIIAGARPMGAKIAENASVELSAGTLTDTEIEAAAKTAADELVFGSNMRATGEYRKALCRVLVKRAVMEVLKCR